MMTLQMRSATVCNLSSIALISILYLVLTLALVDSAQGKAAPPVGQFDARPQFHFLPPSNWMNDPNGLMYYNGVYHMFYQYNPYAAVWGNMHWGHAVGYDLVHWTYLPPAIAPSEDYDINGIFSGSSTILPDNTPIAFYTGVSSSSVESQCVAYPLDLTDKFLVNWTKSSFNPVITAPTNFGSLAGFRDPTTAWLDSGRYEILVGSGVNNTIGTAFVFSTTDFETWNLESMISSGIFPGNMWECPDFYKLENELGESVYVLKGSASGQDWWATGTYDPVSNTFNNSKIGLYDNGIFYASKTFFDGEGRRILFGWVREGMDESQYFFEINKSNEDDSQQSQVARGWAGVQSLPRVITLNWDGSLSMNPLPDLSMLRSELFTLSNVPINNTLPIPQTNGTQLEIQVTFSNITATRYGVNVLASPTSGEFTSIYFEGSTVSIDRTNSSLAPDANKSIMSANVGNNTQSFTLFVDHSMIELFCDNNRQNIISRVYPTAGDATTLQFFAENGSVVVNQLSIWQMESIW